jgi:peroxiredoxin family protein
MFKICYIYNQEFSYLKNMFLNSLDSSKNSVILYEKKVSSKYQDSGYGSKSWYEFAKIKIEFLYEKYSKLKDNEIILCSDVDVYFKDSKKAIEIIQKKFKENPNLDFLGMSENNNHFKTKKINGGFFTVRKNKLMDLFFQNILSINYEYFKFADQDIINICLRTMRVNYETLDNNQFVNGCFINEIQDKNLILLVHATCCQNIEEKINLIHNIANKEHKSIMVVSKYQESIDWIRNIEIPHLIYNKYPKKHHKSNRTTEDLNILNIDNIGFEEFVYLSYIVDNYYSLPETIIFTQANPFVHSPDFLKLTQINNVYCYSDVQPLSKFWIPEVPFYELRKNTETILSVNNSVVQVYFFNKDNHRYNIKTNTFDFYGKWQKEYTVDLKKFLSTDNIRKTIFEIIGIKPRNFNNIEMTPMCYGAILSVSKNMILRHPKKFYEKLLALSIKHNAKLFACSMELAWLEIFGYEPPEELYNQEKYQQYMKTTPLNKYGNDLCEFVQIPITKNKNKYMCLFCEQNINEYDYLNSKHCYNCSAKIIQILKQTITNHPS